MAAFGRVMRLLRTGDGMTAAWVRDRARVLLVLNLVLTAGAVAMTHRAATDGRLISVDFVSFYAAGRLALDGQPALAYDPAAHARAEAAVAGPGRPYQFFFYPPPYLLLCAALATLPYAMAIALFEAASLGLFMLVVRHVAGPGPGPGPGPGTGRGAAAWPVLAFSPLFWAIGLGQNALLSAALLGAATLLVERRPIGAGVLFGALCYKPHLGLLVPVALASGRCWRSFAAAAGTTLGLCTLSWGLFGTATWRAYLHGFLASGDTYGSGRISFAGMISPFGAARLAGLGLTPALTLQSAATVAAAAAVAWIWHRRSSCIPASAASSAVRAAGLLAATLLALPVLLLYDQMLLLVALFWLVQEGRSSGFLAWEKAILAAAFLLPMLSLPLSMMLSLPVAPLPAVLLLGLCLAHRARLGSEPIAQPESERGFGRTGDAP